MRLSLTSMLRCGASGDMVPTLAAETTRRLSELEVGDIARMVDAAIDPEAQSLLQALGLTDNSQLRVCKRGEPCVVQVRATRIGISSRIAQHITVVTEPAERAARAGAR
jgi:Fe2+ transport system protein FeoA